MATPSTRRRPTLPAPLVPPLEPGDHLTRDEFERRYNAMPELKKAELIEGEVHMSSAVRWNYHAGPHADLIGWLVAYRAYTDGVRVGDNGSLRLDMENMPQPDATLIVDPACGGKVKLSPDDYIEGAPEWIAEVSASTASLDLNKKLRVYRRNNVLEYVVWRVMDEAVDWFVLKGSDYERLSVGPNGLYQSQQFPGLWLDPAALARGDMATVLQTVQKGVESPEHAEFVARLRQTSS